MHLRSIALFGIGIALHAGPVGAQVLLNEVLPAPGADWNGNGIPVAAEDEWLEIYNAGAVAADVDGWFVTDAGDAPRFGLAGNLAPGEFLFVTGELATDWETANGYSALGLSLNNAGDTVKLFQVAGGTTTLVDSLEYGGLASDVSLGRFPDGSPDWVPFDALDGGTGPQPTPGGDNGGIAHPKILSAEIDPSFVTSVDPVVVRATLGDTDGIAAAVVRLRVNGGAIEEHPMSLVNGTITLGTWEWTLGVQPAGTTLGIVVRASDGSLIEETNEFEVTVLGADSPVVLNEILADPATDETGDANGDGVRDGADDEFVEIVNRGSAPVDLTGWTLRDATALRHEFPAGLVLPVGAYYVVFGGGTPTGIPSGVEVASTGGLSLNNSGEEVQLVGPDALPRDVHAWGSEGNADQSMIRLPDGTGDWTRPGDEGLPDPFTPGRPNSGTTSIAAETWGGIKALYRE
ncbi:MAG: lamin tail domain-containing protein [bacterium]